MNTSDSTATRDLVATARAITERELVTYAERTAAFAGRHRRARKVLPLGVPSSFQAYDPHPIVVRRASGSRMVDVDGNDYVDYDMGFGALFAGHMHPAVRRRGRGAARRRHAVRHAVRAQRRGRRAARRALRPADVALHQLRHRGDDGRHPRRPRRHRREKIVKVEGGYHGHHDEVMISDEAAARRGRPGRRAARRCPPSAGITAGVLADTIVIPYNDPDALERVLAERRRGVLHRRTGDGEHRHLPAAAGLPRGRPRDHRASTARC